MQSTPVNSPHGPVPAGGYSQALDVQGATRWLVISGQIPVDQAGVVPANFTEQADLVWKNILAQLGAAGMGVATAAANRSANLEFEVADVDGALARMAGAAEVVMPTTVMPWGNRSAWLRDPDGSLVNVFSRPAGQVPTA